MSEKRFLSGMKVLTCAKQFIKLWKKFHVLLKLAHKCFLGQFLFGMVPVYLSTRLPLSQKLLLHKPKIS